MSEDKTKVSEDKSSSIDEILRERERLTRVLQDEFKKEVTVLFTDICGYTEHIDKYGDISGRALIQKHNDIVLTLIEKHGGKVIKTIGDGVMATFKTPLDAVKSSVAIHKRLYEYNRSANTKDRIHLKIGINTGKALVDETDVFGDTVNVAARIQNQAQKGQILISGSLYDRICGSADILCRLHGTAQVRGKAEPMELYRVVWEDKDIVLSAAPKVRAAEPAVAQAVAKPLNVLQLEITREEGHLKISAFEQSAGEVSTVRHYDEISAPIERIGDRCREMVETLNKANRRGRVTREVITRLKEIGQVFVDELFSLNVKNQIRESRADHLIMNLDDQLVHVPWELLHDGRQFLCQRFNMGRLVKTRQAVMSSRKRVLARPLKMLVLADPSSDLKGAYKEGTQIRDYIDGSQDFINVLLRSDNISPDFIKEKIRNFDLVHFAGHADYNHQNPGESGWRLTDGVLQAQEIIKMAGTASMPALIFSNACQSARTEEWNIEEYFQDEIFGLANAFILSGVKHYVGTFWEILDEPSRRFALEFYKHLLAGLTVGAAVREARLALVREYGEETIVWASYLLYGDPTFNYMDQIAMAADQAEPESPALSLPETEVRAPEEVVDFAETKAAPKSRAWLAVAAGVVVLAVFLLFGYPGFLKQDTAQYESEALTYYNDGNFEQALNASKILEDKNPKVRLSYLIQGNIHLRAGRLDAAETAYQKALQATKGTDQQKAEAFIGLGRIASLRKQTDIALSFYKQATDLDPAGGLGYLSQAMLMDNSGKPAEALSLLTKAAKLAPQDRLLTVVTNETRKKVAVIRDQEKRDHIDKMVKGLLESMKEPPRALPSDGWTSPPLTLWLMDFSTRGYSLREGEERLISAGITDQLIQYGRVQVVERALLDKLLEELNLGTSGLADRSTALSLGRLLSARLILSGQIVYAGPDTQVSLRLIETETGKITAAINEPFESTASSLVLSDKISEVLTAKINQLYPLKGKIVEIKGAQAVINIGEKQGVRAGQKFKVIEKEGLLLEVLAVSQDKSTVKVSEGQGMVEAGFRVQETF